MTNENREDEITEFSRYSTTDRLLERFFPVIAAIKFKNLNSGDWFKKSNKSFMKIDRIEDKWGSAWNAVSILGIPEEFDDNEDVANNKSITPPTRGGACS
jgi:hypothetical protein